MSLAHNGGGERCLEMQAAVKLFACPDENVGGPADAPKQAVRTLGETVAGLIRHPDYYHQIVVAVRAGLAACGRAKEIDAVRLEGCPETLDDFSQLWVVA